MKTFTNLLYFTELEDFKNDILSGVYDIPNLIKYIKEELARISRPEARWERLGVHTCKERLKIIYELYPEYEVVT